MPYCSLLDTHVCVVLPSYYKPCCQYTKYAEIYEDILVHEMSHREYISLPQFQKIKHDMKTGWHKGCEKCKIDEEQNKIVSLRQMSNHEYNCNKGIQFIEISLSNYCNLSCKMCNPNASSKWKNYIDQNSELLRFFSQNNFEKISIKKTFEGLDLKNLKKIKYLGGEPFITPETKDLLDFLETNNIIQNVQLITNTNCTYFPKKWIPQLLKFKYVNIGLSVDGFDKSCEYSRTGCNWNTIQENIAKWYELHRNNKNINIYFSTTINALTIQDYHKLKDFSKNLSIDVYPYVIHQPSYLKLEALPTEYLQSIKNKDNQQYIDGVIFDPNLFRKFKEFICITDKAQRINLKHYIPELAKYFDK